MKKTKISIQIIYNEIKTNPKVSQKELSRKYNVCERTIRRYCKVLKDSGYIKYVIDSKNSKWKIINKW